MQAHKRIAAAGATGRVGRHVVGGSEAAAKPRAPRYGLETLQLEQATNLAFEVGRYKLRIEQDGAASTDVGKYVLIHRWHPDGSWRRAVASWV